MDKTYYSGVDEEVMKIETTFSDRFVYSYNYIPLEVKLDDGKPSITHGQMKVMKFIFRKAEGGKALSENEVRNRIHKILEHLNNPEGKQIIKELLNPVLHKGKKVNKIPPATTCPDEDSDQIKLNTLLAMLRSEVGYLFLDRTRIRPKGFAIGEHVYTLSLAPGEEIIIEQKTFSKKEATYEEINEQDMEFDLELSSTLNTEISEGMDSQQSKSENTKFGISGEAGIQAEIVKIGVSPSYSNDVNEASSKTARDSLKNSSTSSSKVASKYRAQHKITFKVATEQRFETSSKRTIRNPNKYSPIDLHYFKILNRLEMTQERTGIRLCWTPTIKDPGYDLSERIRKGKEEIYEKYTKGITLPEKPEEPVKAEAAPKVVPSGQVEADRWGTLRDMRADYEVGVYIPQGYEWDGDKQFVKDSLQVYLVSVDNQVATWIVGEPWEDGPNHRIVLKVHVGAGCFTDGHIYLSTAARFLPVPTGQDAYTEDYNKWQDAMKEWQQKVNDILIKSNVEAEKEAKEFEEKTLASVKPYNEFFNRLIRLYFPAFLKDESWEVELWNKIFDWGLSSVEMFPGWWSDLPMREPSGDPCSIMNASYAKLYLPIRMGYEKIALSLIYTGLSKSLRYPESQELYNMINRIVDNLESYRTQYFGSNEININDDNENTNVSERIQTIGKWMEYMPTDGTHIEVSLGVSNACDKFSKSEFDNSDAFGKAEIDELLQNVELKKNVTGNIKSAEVKVFVDTGNVEDRHL